MFGYRYTKIKQVRGVGMAGSRQAVDFEKMAKLEFESKENTAELVGIIWLSSVWDVWDII